MYSVGFPSSLSFQAWGKGGGEVNFNFAPVVHATDAEGVGQDSARTRPVRSLATSSSGRGEKMI